MNGKYFSKNFKLLEKTEQVQFSIEFSDLLGKFIPMSKFTPVIKVISILINQEK